jgi:hypothetical protein
MCHTLVHGLGHV